MTRYVYSLLRFVPNPASGEFVNLGAVVGCEATGDFNWRHVQNDQRAKGLAGDRLPVSTFYSFLDGLVDDIERKGSPSSLDDENDAGFTFAEDWLTSWFERSRNTVQLSAPTPIVADSADGALDLLFEHMINDPARNTLPYRTRRAVFGELRRAYSSAGVLYRVHQRCRLNTEQYASKIDFVVGSGHAVQLAQAYSFGIASQGPLASEVKAWGWTLRELRDKGGMAFDQDGAAIQVANDVDIKVVYAAPEGPPPQAFREARAVFADLGVEMLEENNAEDVATIAEALLAPVA
jgi:hypothetical protein